MSLLLGAHVPTTAGLKNAPSHGCAIGADVVQVFTRNQVQWRARPVSDEEALSFKNAVLESGLQMVVTHASYLVNLASPKADILAKSKDAFLAEMQRCSALGIRYLIFHPGAHMGSGREAGLARIAESLDDVLERAPLLDVTPLLEVTAGQGSYVGSTFEDLRAIIEMSRVKDRLGVCLDTCHLWASGYDIKNPAGYEETVSAFVGTVGLERLKAIHLNDAKKDLGSKADRHEAIGEGFLGVQTFERIVNDDRFGGVPMILETPGELDLWKKEIALLRDLRRED